MFNQLLTKMIIPCCWCSFQVCKAYCYYDVRLVQWHNSSLWITFIYVNRWWHKKEIFISKKRTIYRRMRGMMSCSLESMCTFCNASPWLFGHFYISLMPTNKDLDNFKTYLEKNQRKDTMKPKTEFKIPMWKMCFAVIASLRETIISYSLAKCAKDALKRFFATAFASFLFCRKQKSTTKSANLFQAFLVERGQ